MSYFNTKLDDFEKSLNNKKSRERTRKTKWSDT